jgi:uncharacterized phiE125 gp8 family phage protein
VAGLDLVTPSAEPVSLDLAKLHCRVDHDDEDPLITAYISMARYHVEGFVKASLLPTVWRYRIDEGFPREIRLPTGPVLSAAALEIKYVDDAGVLQTLAPSSYQSSLGDTAIIRPAYGEIWPSTRCQMDAVQITFTAGWANVETLPAPLRSGVLLMIGQLYANREPVAFGVSVAEIPHTIRDLLLPHVRW